MWFSITVKLRCFYFYGEEKKHERGDKSVGWLYGVNQTSRELNYPEVIAKAPLSSQEQFSRFVKAEARKPELKRVTRFITAELSEPLNYTNLKNTWFSQY